MLEPGSKVQVKGQAEDRRWLWLTIFATLSEQPACRSEAERWNNTFSLAASSGSDLVVG